MSKLGKDIMSYGVIDLIGRTSGLITSPITTRLLSLSQYGAGPLLSAVWAPVGLLQYGGMDSAYPYFRAQTNDSEEQMMMLTTATYISHIFNVVIWAIFAVVGMYGIWLAEYANVSEFELFLFIIGILPSSILYWFLYLLRFMRDTRLFGKITILSRILPAFITIPLLMSVEQPDRLIMSWSIGCIIQYLSLAYALHEMRKAGIWPYLRDKFSSPLAKKMMRYGIFLAPMFMIYSLTTVTDRILVGWFLGAEDVAILQLALAIGGIGLMLSSWFGLAFDPHLIEWIGAGKIDAYLPKVQMLQHVLAATFLGLTAGAAIWSEWFFHYVYPEAYMESARLIPLLFLAGTFPVLSRLAIATIMIANKPKAQMTVYMTAFLINLVVGLLAIPYYGVMGAVLGTLAAEAFILLSWIVLGRVIFRNFYLTWMTSFLSISAVMVFLFIYKPGNIGTMDAFIQAIIATTVLAGTYFAYLRASLGREEFRKLIRLPMTVLK